ncbi:MAG: NMN amidohydrolase-like protein YfaY [Alphaproteobacteria bacterium MarineAlpha5_Bin11]|nr:competence/damage-inducible protein A [Pelagibacteraceae bacterium]PPR43698.1 MAG: NMN amidohydrolase-like protein YfaY [Alphaproteobacteria bacterium MarineAlpha5_Bin11]PPR51350.1 MAG: NMN amidohydrolase-like protein YfaY [Alphaproteobacteria bacterium MarineAlpha5_Bin10]|tara:strand:+ start:30497 stop:31252 length:756 start_codon:yes stop_codon:yes gene_type:complete
MSKITSAILIIGNEILFGRTQDANTQFIAINLKKIGIILREVRVVADTENDIINSINELRNKYDYVFSTGGIGPTHDDITSKSISKAFGLNYLIHPEAYAILKNYYPENELNSGRIKMTKMPEGAKLIKNKLTVAPGFFIQNVFVLPGVPKILQVMFLEVMKNLKRGKEIISKTINTNLYESIIAEELEKIQNKFNDCEIGSYPHFDFNNKTSKIGGVNIVVSGTNKLSVDLVIKKINLIILKFDGKSQIL